jgi:maltose O-acetyltransferase
MKSEKEKMLAGELYDSRDPELVEERKRCRKLCKSLIGSQDNERHQILADLLGYRTDAWVEPPFFCDYGYNLSLGEKVYFNYNCIVLDVNRVEIGDNVLFGPAVQIYTAMHPKDAHERRKGLEFAIPVNIGSDVWIGGGAVICPGVTIGNGTVIGAGSVVTRAIPAGVFAAGNPCRVVRPVKENL